MPFSYMDIIIYDLVSLFHVKRFHILQAFRSYYVNNRDLPRCYNAINLKVNIGSLTHLWEKYFRNMN